MIDVYGRVVKESEERKFDGDTLINITNSGKVLNAILLAKLRDQGLISYDDKISQHWPHFASNGKENILIKDLLGYESGLTKLMKKSIPFECTRMESVKNNRIGEIIEASSLSYGFRLISRDWVVNEIFRRVQPEGLTMN